MLKEKDREKPEEVKGGGGFGGKEPGYSFRAGRQSKKYWLGGRIQFFLRVGKRKVVNDMCQYLSYRMKEKLWKILTS